METGSHRADTRRTFGLSPRDRSDLADRRGRKTATVLAEDREISLSSTTPPTHHHKAHQLHEEESIRHVMYMRLSCYAMVEAMGQVEARIWTRYRKYLSESVYSRDAHPSDLPVSEVAETRDDERVAVEAFVDPSGDLRKISAEAT